MNERVKAKVTLLSTSTNIKDIMISYAVEDKDTVLKLREKLRDVHLHAWLESEELISGADIFARIGQAVVDCTAFMFIMTANSVTSKINKDQLALAYVSNKPIIPVALQPNAELLQLMDNGMRLELAGFEWFTIESESFEEDSKNMANNVKKMINDIKEEAEKEDRVASQPAPVKRTRRQLNRTISQKFSANMAKLYLEDGNVYWVNAFGNVTRVTWARFTEKLLYDFKDDFNSTFGADDTEWLLAILRRELEVGDDDTVNRDQYIAFCTVDSLIRPLWSRIQDQARESYAMRGVFDVESSVRVQAIENLGKFKSATVIDALCDLLSDKDANVQAVAIISLARTGANDERTVRQLMRCLKAKDRVVREAACLALGTLKVEAAVNTLVELWRNDIISNVREAALAALKSVGGEKAEEAIRVTTVLEKEIRLLKTS